MNSVSETLKGIKELEGVNEKLKDLDRIINSTLQLSYGTLTLYVEDEYLNVTSKTILNDYPEKLLELIKLERIKYFKKKKELLTYLNLTEDEAK